MNKVLSILLFTITTSVIGQSIIPKPRLLKASGKNIEFGKIEITSLPKKASFQTESFQIKWDFLRGELIDKIPQKEGKTINIILALGYLPTEAYSIQTSQKQIVISASSYAGFYYGVSSLSQLLEAQKNKSCYEISEGLQIYDAPEFSYRGMHLDVSRHFFPTDSILTYIDMLSRYKFNRFHWHLTDDQGWRIEIKKYPLLTQIGSKRRETMLAKNFNPYKGDGKPVSGFYTQEDIRKIIEYAKVRNIEVIPEIEMPGHATAAVAAYPFLSCKKDTLPVATTWGVFEDVYCVNDNTLQFMFDILEEVMDIFPSRLIHIGGDEVIKTRWDNCDICRNTKSKNQLKNSNELQSYFIQKIDSFIHSHNRAIIGWDEILEGGLAENAWVMSWRGTKGGIEAAKQKHNVVMTPGTHCYFDHYQGPVDIEPLAIGGYTTIEKVYNYKIIPEVLNSTQKQFIQGAQGNVWTEYMPNFSHVQYMTLPRMVALSEVLWGTNVDYIDFLARLEHHKTYFKQQGWNYKK